MCDCRSDIEKRLADMYMNRLPTATEHGVALQGYAYSLGPEPSSRPYMRYKASAMVPLKSGTKKLKTSIGNMIFTFCPFCAERIVQLDSESAPA